MTNPVGYLLRMGLFLLAMAVVAALLSPVLLTAFFNNPFLNAFILGVLAIGILWNLFQVQRLKPEVRWLETWRQARSRLATLPTPRLLAPMASMLAAREGRGRDGEQRFTLSTTAMRSLLDGIASRLDESRELSRYMTGLMIFLGLLGTFWGLLKTVGSVADVINAMTVGTGDINALFAQLKTGLVQPLKGMGTAFSASLFGLSGALVLGFLDLTAGQAQNRFFNELEEWLASLTRLSSGAIGDAEGGSVPVYVQALLEQTAENMEGLQRILGRGEEARIAANQAVIGLTERVGVLADATRASQTLMTRIGEAQAQIAPILHRLAEPAAASADEAAMREHLRAIEALLNRLLGEAEQGRNQTTSELRHDIRVLTRTVAALAEERPG